MRFLNESIMGACEYSTCPSTRFMTCHSTRMGMERDVVMVMEQNGDHRRVAFHLGKMGQGTYLMCVNLCSLLTPIVELSMCNVLQ